MSLTDANPGSAVAIRVEEIDIATHLDEGMLRGYGVYARQAFDESHLPSVGLQLLVDASVQLLYGLLQVRQMIQVHTQHEAVMLLPPALKGFYQLGNLPSHLSWARTGGVGL